MLFKAEPKTLILAIQTISCAYKCIKKFRNVSHKHRDTQSFVFSDLGWKSKDHFKSKGHSKSKGLKAFKGTKAKSYIHKGLAKRSAEPGLGWSWSRGFYWKGHFKAKGNSWKGKP